MVPWGRLGDGGPDPRFSKPVHAQDNDVRSINQPVSILVPFFVQFTGKPKVATQRVPYRPPKKTSEAVVAEAFGGPEARTCGMTASAKVNEASGSNEQPTNVVTVDGRKPFAPI